MTRVFQIVQMAVVLLLPLAGEGAQYGITRDFGSGQVIPDGNPTGWSDRYQYNAGADLTVSAITVSLNVSGGWNGDLYAYLSYAPQGGGSAMAVLLNRVGRTSVNPFGYSNTGFDITLSGLAAYDVHSYQVHSPAYDVNGRLTGTWQADGRNLDPAVVLDTSNRDAPLSAFNNLGANGTWTLFFADMSGGSQSSINGWSLGIETVPEPVNVALGAFGAAAAVFAAGRKLYHRSRSEQE